MKSRNVTKWSQTGLLLLSMIFLFSAVGCETKKDKERREDKEQIASEKKEIKEKEESRLSQLRFEISERTRVYNALGGYYKGEYTQTTVSGNGSTTDTNVGYLSIIITPKGMPSDTPMNRRKNTEGELQLIKDSISLDIDIIEVMPNVMHPNCVQTGLHPDFKTGTMRVSCQLASAIYLTYIIALDSLEPRDGYAASETASQRSAALSSNLLRNKIGEIDALNVTIRSPLVDRQVHVVRSTDSIQHSHHKHYDFKK